MTRTEITLRATSSTRKAARRHSRDGTRKAARRHSRDGTLVWAVHSHEIDDPVITAPYVPGIFSQLTLVVLCHTPGCHSIIESTSVQIEHFRLLSDIYRARACESYSICESCRQNSPRVRSPRAPYSSLSEGNTRQDSGSVEKWVRDTEYLESRVCGGGNPYHYCSHCYPPNTSVYSRVVNNSDSRPSDIDETTGEEFYPRFSRLSVQDRSDSD
ncbi:P1 [Imperata yellow mottle virus]|uniref:p1 n=1 Tax=Imperata yellow mottle virus TaxID=524023 RepID=B5WYM5_9VIRU|nr:putative movement protein [Imperata yellow mottle virus]CAQ48411.1 P1 [Imperata yellow mottle virus]